MIASEVRACIAAIAIAHASKQQVSAIYDYEKAEHLEIAAAFQGDTLNGFDLQRAAQLSGSLPNIRDHDRAGFITLNHEGSAYTGYDHPSKTHFNIEVSDRAASFYDHDAKVWTQYSAA